MVYFISDAHLGAGYIREPLRQEIILAQWLDSISTDATELYLLGDIMDYWFEYRNVIPRGHTRFLGALARLADAGVKITWLKGNHDIWMTDYLTSETGCRIHDGILDTTIGGRRFVLEHGDGVGRRPMAFRIMRRLFRSSVARIAYAAIHPRWTVGFAHAWSSHSRKQGGYSGGAAAVDNISTWADDYMAKNGFVDFFVIGHLHHPVQKNLGRGAVLTILGESYSQMSYARFDGTKIELLKIDDSKTEAKNTD